MQKFPVPSFCSIREMLEQSPKFLPLLIVCEELNFILVTIMAEYKIPIWQELDEPFEERWTMKSEMNWLTVMLFMSLWQNWFHVNL